MITDFNEMPCGFTAHAQVEFAGLTGTVKFDKYGLRRNFKLDVLEVSLNRGLAKVSHQSHCYHYLHQRKNVRLCF